MSYIENNSQVTEISYKIIESNLFWEIINPTDLNPTIKSNKIKIPMINGEW